MTDLAEHKPIGENSEGFFSPSEILLSILWNLLMSGGRIAASLTPNFGAEWENAENPTGATSADLPLV